MHMQENYYKNACYQSLSKIVLDMGKYGYNY